MLCGDRVHAGARAEGERVVSVGRWAVVVKCVLACGYPGGRRIVECERA